MSSKFDPKADRGVVSYRFEQCGVLRGHPSSCELIFTLADGTEVCARFLRANEVKPAFDLVHGAGKFDKFRGDSPIGPARKSAKNLLIDGAGPNGSANGTAAPAPVRDPEPEPVREPAAAPAAVPPAAGSIDAMIDARIEAAVANGKAGLDEQKVREIVEDCKATLAPNVTKFQWRDNEPIELSEGSYHYLTPDVLDVVNAGEIPFLVGPAGTGKSTIGRTIAKIRGVEYRSIGCNPTMTESKLFGYNDAQGNYHETGLSYTAKNGGVFGWDEIDACHPGTLVAGNDFLASREAMFGSEWVQAHPDFVAIASGNTFGTGANAEYVGRNPLDHATLDRFVQVEIDYDRNLERAIAESINAEVADVWLELVERLRANRDEYGIKAVVSTRFVASLTMLAGDTDGRWDCGRLIRSRIVGKLSNDQAAKLTTGCAPMIRKVDAAVAA